MVAYSGIGYFLDTMVGVRLGWCEWVGIKIWVRLELRWDGMRVVVGRCRIWPGR